MKSLPQSTESFHEELPPYSPWAGGGLVTESGDVLSDGRIDVDLNSTIAKTLAQIIDLREEDLQNPPPDYEEYIQKLKEPVKYDIKLNIVIQIVGSRGDVQPFIALGNQLQKYGHRVRLATHNVFAEFVTQNGLEFYPIGGDPAELMAFMVKNPSLLPQMESLYAGEVQKKRKMVATILDGCWRSCIDDDPITKTPFVADAIIANPPSFAHIHCAQALKVPVHLMFTMPWSSTRAFPHPLANLRPSEMSANTANWVSYGVVEWLTWQGLGDVINSWRASIDLEPIPMTEGPRLAETLKIPFTYCWSPALFPKPNDWPEYLDVCGFFFRERPIYDAPPELQHFLESGPSPIYIGFGSIVVDNPQQLTDTVLQAVAEVGIRAIISRGWAKLSGIDDPNILYIDDCPHEWLFQHVAAVVHHGGAGTTACGLANGRPTVVVPFLGDQYFWGNMIARAGAGPRPIAYTSLTSHNLADAIRYCLKPETMAVAQNIATRMQKESGVTTAADSFHRRLPLSRMRCQIFPNQLAVWKYTGSKEQLQLSKTAAQFLINYSKIDPKYLRRNDINPIIIENRRWDPLSGLISSAASTGTGLVKSAAEMLYNPYKEYTRSQSQAPSDLNANTINSQRSPVVTAGAMAGEFMKGVGKVIGTYFKGVVVDMPHAVAEGFRQVPRLYGDQPKEYQSVQDWKSGAVVGGRNFVDGMTEGFTGIVTQPIKGAQEEGALGAVKGFAKGTIGLATKVPSAGLGLVAYPFHGIMKSIESTVRSKTRRAIINARLREGYDLTRRIDLSPEEVRHLLQRFESLMQGADV